MVSSIQDYLGLHYRGWGGGGGEGGNRRAIAPWPLFPQEIVECGFSWQNSDAELKKKGGSTEE